MYTTKSPECIKTRELKLENYTMFPNSTYFCFQVRRNVTMLGSWALYGLLGTRECRPKHPRKLYQFTFRDLPSLRRLHSNAKCV